MNGTPLPKANELFNQMSQVAFDDVAGARRLERELSTLNLQKRGNPTTLIALAQALLTIGRREDAINIMDGAFNLRAHATFPEADRLAVLYLFVGNRERALILAEEIGFNPDLIKIGMTNDNLATVAAWAGDVALLVRFAKDNLARNTVGVANEFVKFLKETEIAEAFSIHQKLLNSVVRDYQLACSLLLNREEDGKPVAVNTIFFDPRSISRRDLEKKWDESLDGCSLGVDISETIFDIFSAATYVASGPFQVVS